MRTMRLNVARALAAMNAKLTELHRVVEAHGLAVSEILGLTPAQARRYRERLDETYQRIVAAGALGQWLADWGTYVPTEHEGAPLTMAERGAAELAASHAAGTLPELELLDLYELVEPDPEPHARGWLAGRLGRKRAA